MLNIHFYYYCDFLDPTKFSCNRDTFFLAVVLSLSFFTALAIREKAKIDDALEVSSIHGITGAIGSLAIAFLADTDENPVRVVLLTKKKREQNKI